MTVRICASLILSFWWVSNVNILADLEGSRTYGVWYVAITKGIIYMVQFHIYQLGSQCGEIIACLFLTFF